MLPQFRVPQDEAVLVSGDDLKTTVAAVLQKMGVPKEDAELGADVMVLADLRGVESHGVSNLMQSYVSGYGEGNLKPRASWRVVRESPGTATIEINRLAAHPKLKVELSAIAVVD